MRPRRFAALSALLLCLPLAAGAQGSPQNPAALGAPAEKEPPPATRLAVNGATVTRAAPEETKLFTYGGVLDARGYASAVFSLAGRVKGYPEREAAVGVILIPDRKEILDIFRDEQRIRFPIRIDLDVPDSRYGLFEAGQVEMRLAFPSYRVYFYNTGPRPVSLTLYAYLSNR